MDCKEAEKLIYLYPDGELGSGERQKLMDHLAACKECRTEFQEFTAFNEKVEALFKEKDIPSENFRERIMEGVSHTDMAKNNKRNRIIAVCSVAAVAALVVFTLNISPIMDLIKGRGTNQNSSISQQGSPPAGGYGDYPYYNDAKSLVGDSDMVILGEVTKVNDAENIDIGAGSTMLYTVSEVKVLEVIKGNIKAGDIVKVKQQGDGKSGTWVEDAPKYLVGNSQYVLFLQTYENAPASMLNPIQGYIAIENGKAEVDPANTIFKDGISKEELINLLKQ